MRYSLCPLDIFVLYKIQRPLILKGVISMMPELLNPGTDNQAPGTYKEVGPRGGEIKNGRVVTIAKGDRLPPTQEAGHKWKKQ